MANIREALYERISVLAQAQKLPRDLEFFATFADLWEEKKVDAIFRGAPHMLITSAPSSVPTPLQDCIIAMTYFELFAQSQDVGTVWGGLANWAFTELAPEFKSRLGIPENHQIGYVMPFGRPTIHYQRTVQHFPARINRIN